jgi:large subunit ribosomal protein L20
MSRVKRGTTSLKRRRNVLRRVKGYRFARSKKERAAREAIAHAGKYAFAHRRRKKGDFRRIWQVKINAASRTAGLSYSAFMNALKKQGIALDRKILASFAEKRPETFARIVQKTTGKT